MTIGIAVYGPGAGLAAFRALQAVEKVGRGALGGFVSFVALTGSGELLRAETQRGGTATLFTRGERTGAPPPPAIAEAPLAALMSSGPDRPAPLSQFTPARAGIGVVTGHRLPNMPGADGVPLNLAVLDRMAGGAPVAEAVAAELARNPDSDAGIIALGVDGALAVADTDSVAARGDLGRAVERRGRLAVAVLHNAIHPHRAIAPLAAAAAFDALEPLDRADFEIVLDAGLALAVGDAHRVEIDAEDRVVAVAVPRRWWLAGRREGSVLGFAAEVRRAGRTIGRTTVEPYCVVEDGRLLSMSGARSTRIGVRLAAGDRDDATPDRPRRGAA